MKGRMFKLILSALMSSATVLTSVPASAFAETAGRANSESNHAHVHEHDDCEETDEHAHVHEHDDCEETDEHIHEDCYEEDVLASCAEEHEHAEDAACCDSHEELLLGDGITVAVLDSGITSFETAKDISFVDDAEFSEHGNMMAETLINEVPEITLYDVRVLDSEGKGKYSDISEAIVWSVDNDADIIVMSFEGYEASTILEDAINYAAQNDVLMIAAAGNDGLEKAVYPAAYPTVISAGSLNEDGNISSFSNYGASVDVFVNASAGTSVAAQHVAADAVRYMQENPSATDEEAREALVGSKSKDFTPVSGSADSYVYEAVTHHYGSWYTYTNATCEKNRVERRKCSDKYCYAYQERTVSNTKLGHSLSRKTVNPTCTAQGYCYDVCTRSGCSYTSGKYGYVPAIGHSYTVNAGTKRAATCTQTGIVLKKCSRCPSIIEQNTSALSHSTVRRTVNPTCTAQGYSYDVCTRSGCSYTSGKYGYVPAIGHDYSKKLGVKRQPTCTEKGLEIRGCSRCSATTEVNTAALGHATTTKTVNPTCTTDGYTYDVCTRSGCTYSANKRGYVTSPGHNFSKTIAVKRQPTCTEKGLEIRGCSRCSATTEVNTAALKHATTRKTVNPTCTSQGYSYDVCTRSGCTYTSSKYGYVPAIGHDYSVKIGVKRQPTCTEKGLEIRGCSRCSATTEVNTPARGHSMTTGTSSQGYPYYYCARDNCSYIKPVEITKQPANVKVAFGSKASTSVAASGYGLSFQWYYKNAGASSFSKSSQTSSTYSATMSSTVDGRQVYCVVTDKYGNTVKSNTATLKSKVAITKQPTNATAKYGSTVKTTVTATGNGLKYQWYVKSVGYSSFSKSSITSATYSTTMSSTVDGRQLYCVVTDKYGNTVKSNTITFKSNVSITKQPSDTYVSIGSTAKATVIASGSGLKYQWYYTVPGGSVTALPSSTSSTYSVTMTAAISGRQVYCVITDKYGNKLKSSTATLRSKATITKQPTSVFVTMGSTAKTSVTATGNGLKYQWYYKNAGASSFSKSSQTSSTYSATMSSTVDGRQVYCEITDTYGKKVKSNTATLKSKVAITKQPTNATAKYGSTVKTTVTATGNGLKYQWYYKNAGASSFSKSSQTSSTYSATMSSTVDGRQVYCVVTDKYGNTVKSNTATLKSKFAITKQPSDTYVSIGSTAKATVIASGSGLKYQWYYTVPGGSVTALPSSTSSTYSVTMTAAISGRQVYCVITDKYGNKLKSSTATLRSKATITKQPTNATAKYGSTVKTTVTATGNGLKYQWYYKNAGASSFSKSSITSATYSATMSSTVDGRQVYCEITDTYGKKVKSNTATLKSKVAITKQPSDGVYNIGDDAKTSVTATGKGLKYTWYVKDPEKSEVKSKITTATYSFELSKSTVGRQVYCVVSDAYNNKVTSRTATFTNAGLTVNDCSYDKFYFRGDGSLDYSSHELCHDINGSIYLKLKISSNVSWTVSSPSSYVHFMNTNGTKISSGSKGTSYLVVKLDSFPLTSTSKERQAKFTIKAGNVLKTYTVVQSNFTCDGNIAKAEYTNYMNNKIKKSDFLKKFENNSSVMSALLCERITNNIEVFNSENYYLAVRTWKYDPGTIYNEYIVYQIAAWGDDNNVNERVLNFEVAETDGMKIVQNANAPLIKMNVSAAIDSDLASTQDSRKKAELIGGVISDALGLSIDIGAASFGIDIPIPVSFVIGKIIDEGTKKAINKVCPDVSKAVKTETVQGYMEFSMSEKCELKTADDNMLIKVNSSTPITAVVSYDIVSTGLSRPDSVPRTW